MSYNLPKPALEDPMGWLKAQIHATGFSSLEIERQSGVSASTIRAVLNGRTGGLRCTVWAALVKWLVTSRNMKRAA